MTAGDIFTLIEARHSDSVVISECKTGGSFRGQMRMFDAWVMPKSWAHPYITGYEIKVDRGDFLADNKWMEYLPYCNYFYFICPKGLIDVGEVSADAGLMYVLGSRCKVVKKSPLRQITIPDSIFRYILMARAKIIPSNYYLTSDEDKSKFFRRWLETKEITGELGRHISKSLRKAVDEEIYKVRNENAVLKNKILEYDGVRETLQQLGIDDSFVSRYIVERKVRELKTTVTNELKARITTLLKLALEIDGILDKAEETSSASSVKSVM